MASMNNESSPSTTNNIQTLIATRRPWPQFFDITSFTLPPLNIAESTARIKRNLLYFRVNYAITILLLLFVSLLWHPFSLIVFLVVFVAWFFLYFFRDVPLTVFNYTFDDRAVLAFLGVVTVGSLVLTSVWVNVLASVLIGAAVICLHGAIRSTDNLVGDDQESPFHTLLPNDEGDSPRGMYDDI